MDYPAQAVERRLAYLLRLIKGLVVAVHSINDRGGRVESWESVAACVSLRAPWSEEVGRYAAGVLEKAGAREVSVRPFTGNLPGCSVSIGQWSLTAYLDDEAAAALALAEFAFSADELDAIEVRMKRARRRTAELAAQHGKPVAERACQVCGEPIGPDRSSKAQSCSDPCGVRLQVQRRQKRQRIGRDTGAAHEEADWAGEE